MADDPGRHHLVVVLEEHVQCTPLLEPEWVSRVASAPRGEPRDGPEPGLRYCLHRAIHEADVPVVMPDERFAQRGDPMSGRAEPQERERRAARLAACRVL